MDDSKFIKILIMIVVLGIIATIAHAVYICYAYYNSSIIQFIARELWL